MKPIIVALTFSIFLITALIPVKSHAQASVSLQVFYDELMPYGDWTDNPDYGYIWIPDVPADFVPYGSNGYWVFTDAGWTWLSVYIWGWAPFHYGRWYNDPVCGYAWIPGTEWGPGWVTWRGTAAHYGWAPIGPGISSYDAYSNSYLQPDNEWHFVANSDFGNINLQNYYITSNHYRDIIHVSSVINNMYEDRMTNVNYNTGPERTDVQRYTGHPIHPVLLKNSLFPEQVLLHNEYRIYRPGVNNTTTDIPAPKQIILWNNGKPLINEERYRRKTENEVQTDEQIIYQQQKPAVKIAQPLLHKPLQKPDRGEVVPQPVAKPPVPVISTTPLRRKIPLYKTIKKTYPESEAAKRKNFLRTQVPPKKNSNRPSVVPQLTPVKQEHVKPEKNDRNEPAWWPDLPQSTQPQRKRNKVITAYLQSLPLNPYTLPVKRTNKASE